MMRMVGCNGLGVVPFRAWIDPLMVLLGCASWLGLSLFIFSEKFSINFCMLCL